MNDLSQRINYFGTMEDQKNGIFKSRKINMKAINNLNIPNPQVQGVFNNGITLRTIYDDHKSTFKN